MTTGKRTPVRVDRRTTIKWLAASMAVAQTSCGRAGKQVGTEIPPADGDLLLGVASAPQGTGYGTDPDLMNPVVPWSRTMTDAQLRTAAALADLMLPEDEMSPAASTVGVPDFIDEWISAPYPEQREDRVRILAGLEWLERESRGRFDTGFSATTTEQSSELLDSLAFPVAATAELADQIEFFRRFRFLAVGAFYSTEAGMRDAGYVGNVAISGKYPGPSDAAMAHLAGVLERLGLSLTD
jgi:Gluconate 2-dehydrogenase subunit 3